MPNKDPKSAHSEAPTVSIMFHDQIINYLFAELVEAHGVHAEIAHNPEEVRLADRIITEPQYVNKLTEDQKHRCLVVGDPPNTKRLDVLSLTRPFSAEKVEAALDRLLKS
jgi:hypothetical protein